jgi:two-component system cell cycle response regulator
MNNKPTYEELEKRVKNLSEENLKLKEQAIRDPLTGLYNRHFYNTNIEDILEKSAKKKQNIGVIFIDIDNFKNINDNFEQGHEQGDKVLRDLARIIESSTKSSDYIIRWGGDELVVLLSKVNRGIGKTVVKRIIHKIDKYNQHNKIEGKDKNGQSITYALAISAGYAYRNYESTVPIKQTIRLADKRMYNEKRKK